MWQLASAGVSGNRVLHVLEEQLHLLSKEADELGWVRAIGTCSLNLSFQCCERVHGEVVLDLLSRWGLQTRKHNTTGSCRWGGGGVGASWVWHWRTLPCVGASGPGVMCQHDRCRQRRVGGAGLATLPAETNGSYEAKGGRRSRHETQEKETGSVRVNRVTAKETFAQTWFLARLRLSVDIAVLPMCISCIVPCPLPTFPDGIHSAQAGLALWGWLPLPTPLRLQLQRHAMTTIYNAGRGAGAGPRPQQSSSTQHRHTATTTATPLPLLPFWNELRGQLARLEGVRELPMPAHLALSSSQSPPVGVRSGCCHSDR